MRGRRKRQCRRPKVISRLSRPTSPSEFRERTLNARKGRRLGRRQRNQLVIRRNLESGRMGFPGTDSLAHVGQLAESAVHLGEHGQMHFGAGPNLGRSWPRRSLGRWRSSWCSRHLGHSRRRRHSWRLKCRRWGRGGNVRHRRWLNEVSPPLNFMTLNHARAQILYLWRGRASRNTEVRHRRHSRRFRHGWRRWLNLRCLLKVVQQDGMAGRRIGDHRRVAAIQARGPVPCAGKSISGLHRGEARLDPLQFARVFSRYGGKGDWWGKGHSIHRLARAK